MKIERLIVRNFGPVRCGLDNCDGFMEILPVTIFCGNQATGKSTVAKLYSSFVWLEKAFIRGDFDNESFSSENFLSICNNQRIGRYFRSNTCLEYRGEAYSFTYREGKFSAEVSINDLSSYARPKIMYVPSERNLLTVLENAERINSLPSMLSVFLDEYNRAKKKMNGDVYSLPVSGVNIKYDKDSLETIVLTDMKPIPISDASSGIQSVTPLSLVTRYISDDMSLDLSRKVQRLSGMEREAIIEDIRKTYPDTATAANLINTMSMFFNTGISKNLDERMETILKRYFNSRFINIVEEPEQNLYPESQSLVLYELLSCLNRNDDNKLIMTTHSPYILSYLILAAKAAELRDRGIPAEKLSKFVPEASFISGDRIAVYETKEDGSIKRLEPRYGLPSDDNELNLAMVRTNDIFSELLELEADLEES